jgi:hypothetical protein
MSTSTFTLGNSAFLYSLSTGQTHDLNTLIPVESGLLLASARAINSSGQIVGRAVLNGQQRAYLATPTATSPDTTPPKVINTFPKANADDVAPTANVRAIFSEDMRPASVERAFKLFTRGTTTQIAATVSYNSDTDTAKLDPTNNLREEVEYRAVVSTWAKDMAGNRLDQNSSTAGLQQKVWFFEIAD